MSLEQVEIEKMDLKAIDSKIGNLKYELFKLRMQKATSGSDKPHKLKLHRKTIARLLTQKSKINNRVEK